MPCATANESLTIAKLHATTHFYLSSYLLLAVFAYYSNFFAAFDRYYSSISFIASVVVFTTTTIVIHDSAIASAFTNFLGSNSSFNIPHHPPLMQTKNQLIFILPRFFYKEPKRWRGSSSEPLKSPSIAIGQNFASLKSAPCKICMQGGFLMRNSRAETPRYRRKKSRQTLLTELAMRTLRFEVKVANRGEQTIIL